MSASRPIARSASDMCGIVGICGLEPLADGGLVVAMRDTLRHRGPDDAGLWMSADRGVGLGHRRLAVIDLSPAGHQPMSDRRGTLTITYNGEIYNYRELRAELMSAGAVFATQSDTEVILEAYRRFGTGCLERLDGMFAFALYDADREILFAARDRAGEKPFYFWQSGGALAFASELKALIRHPGLERRLDPQAMNFYLAYGYVPAGLSFLQGVRKLPPGHAFVYERRTGRLRAWRYWSLPEPWERTGEKPAEAGELVEEYEALLEASVRRRLVADVPVGLLLSGGVDSSLLAAVASNVSGRGVRAFTVSFPGEPGFDEEVHARLVSRHFGLEHEVLPADDASLDLLPELARQFDEPVADPSILPTFLISRAARRQVTVGIGGDGGDELFGGYPHYAWLRSLGTMRKVLPPFVRGPIAWGAERFVPVGLRGRGHLAGLGGGPEASLSAVNRYFTARERLGLFSPLGELDAEALVSPDRSKEWPARAGRTELERAMALDFSTYLPDDLLVKVDRASMLASLEMRAPFLDHKLIEFAFAKVPDGFRVRGGERKILSRLLARKLLPRGFDAARKQGFVVPLGRWFGNGWGRDLESVLLGPDAWFERRKVEGLLRWQEAGLANTQRLFALEMAELWRREYKVGLPA